MDNSYYIPGGTRPWNSPDSIPKGYTGVGHDEIDDYDKDEIDACLACPLITCMDGTRQCRSYKAKASMMYRRKTSHGV